MAQDTAQQRSEELTAEQQEASAIASLRERYGHDPVLMGALALAWRAGFTRAQLQGHSTRSTSYINPFW